MFSILRWGAESTSTSRREKWSFPTCKSFFFFSSHGKARPATTRRGSGRPDQLVRLQIKRCLHVTIQLLHIQRTDYRWVLGCRETPSFSLSRTLRSSLQRFITSYLITSLTPSLLCRLSPLMCSHVTCVPCPSYIPCVFIYIYIIIRIYAAGVLTSLSCLSLGNPLANSANLFVALREYRGFSTVFGLHSTVSANNYNFMFDFGPM